MTGPAVPDDAAAAAPVRPGAPPALPARRLLVAEVWLVLALSLGASALFALLDLVQALGAPQPLNKQSAVITATTAGGRSVLALTYQLADVAVGLVPVALVVHLLRRSDEPLGAIGLDRERPGREAAVGAALAAAVGGVGLAFYLAAHHLGIEATVVPTTLPPSWWRIPLLVLAAVQNGLLEEVVVCGYLIHRLGQLGWSAPRSVATSAVMRGAYHLYQGVGGFVANAVLGVLFGAIFQRRGRLGRLVVAHSLVDAGAFVGYVLLKGHVSWLP